MTWNSGKEEITKLREEIRRHDYLYYVLAQPEISDNEYDILLHRLIYLEEKFPDLRTPDSPTQRVGGEPLGGFEQIRHSMPMLSLANCYTIEELRDFDKRVRGLYDSEPVYVCELKIDGVAVSLNYRNRILELGATRGDGMIGDDITTNLRTIRAIPLSVGSDMPSDFSIRGEIYYPRKEFEEMNKQRTEMGLKTFMNPRNGAAGTLKLLNSREVAQRPLRFVAYSLSSNDLPVDTQAEVLKLLKACHFPICPEWRIHKNLDGVESFWLYWDQEHDNLPYDTDGVVVKLNDITAYPRLGATAKSPRWAIAFKYSPTNVVTRLNEITWQVGRSGVLTPVAELEPVLLQGTIVKRATLHNLDEVIRLGVQVGDRVEVKKGGDIIPKVVRTIDSKRPDDTRPVDLPSSCPVCGGELVQDESEVAIRCINTNCPAQVKGRLIHFASRGAMDIEGLGAKTIDLLVSQKLVADTGDLYYLTSEQVEALPRLAELSAENLMQGLEKSKKQPFDRILFALGIRHVGSGAARLIAGRFPDYESLKNTSEEALLEIGEIGPVIASSIVNYFKDDTNWAVVEKLIKAGVTGSETGDAKYEQTLMDKTFVLTGTLDSMTRDEAAEAIRIRGGRLASSVSKKTDFVVAGSKPGSKLDKARKLKINAIDESEFLQMIK